MSFRPSPRIDPNAPIPYTLTKKGRAALAVGGQQLARREPGVCRECGNFGTGDPKHPCPKCGMA
jgi:hypothetical protein